MAEIAIRDLEVRQEFDRGAMAMTLSGDFPNLSVDGWVQLNKMTKSVKVGQLIVASPDIENAYELKRNFRILPL